jgi:hypothetical protein
MGNQATRESAKNVFLRVLNLGAAGSMGWFLGKLVFQGDYGISLLGVLGLFVLAIVIHELGHLACALKVDFRVCFFIVGPITIRWNNRRPSIRWGTLKIGGMVGLAPNGIHDLRRRMLIVVAGGPAASFVAGILALVTAWILPASSIGDAFNVGGLISCGLGLLSMLPARRYYSSDGAKIWDLARSKKRGERQCALLALLADLNAGSRPRDWNASLINRILALQDGSGQDVSCYLFAFWWAKDSHDFEAAQQYLEAAIALQKICPPEVKSSIALDAAFFYSLIRGDSAAGRKWLDQCKKRLVTDRYFLLTSQAAVFLSEGKSSDAQRAASEAIAALPKAQFPGFAVAAKDWLEMIAAAAQQGRTSVEIQALAAAR